MVILYVPNSSSAGVVVQHPIAVLPRDVAARLRDVAYHTLQLYCTARLVVFVRRREAALVHDLHPGHCGGRTTEQDTQMQLDAALSDGREGHPPTTLRWAMETRGGCEFTSHEYMPSSRSFAYWMSSCQSLGGWYSSMYRESLLYVCWPNVIRCSSSPLRLTQDTYIKGRGG